MRIVLGVGAGIAAYKSAILLRLLTESGHQVHVLPTEASLNFVGAATWEALSGHPVHISTFTAIDEVNHVRQGQEAELIVIAPATADLIARLSAGMANDLLTTTVLASRAPVVVVPAMHTEMWLNPATQANVKVLRERGLRVMEPDSGRLTGVDSGPGRLPEPADILRYINHQVMDLQSGEFRGELTGLKVLISGGGTTEPLDPVRFLGNRSSGKQAVALAEAALKAGAEVTFLAASMSVDPPAAATVISTPTAADMLEAVTELGPSHDVLIMAAAVADYRPAEVAETKLKKTGGQGLTLELVQNPDILSEAVKARQRLRKPGVRKKARPRLIVGFAAETGDAQCSVEEYGQAKLLAKGCDVLCINDVSGGAGFGQDENTLTVIARGKAPQQVHPVAQLSGSKTEISHQLVNLLADHISGNWHPESKESSPS